MPCVSTHKRKRHMSNYDNGFARAQREYDNQMPPEDDCEECPDCEGEGTILLSNCCGAEMDEDTLMCSKCHDHCDKSVCETCDGTGQIDIKAAKAEAYQEYLENKADEARHEQAMEEMNSNAQYKIGSNIDSLLDRSNPRCD